MYSISCLVKEHATNYCIFYQGVQGLQGFAFCVVTVNDEHTKPRFTRKHRGLIYRWYMRQILFKALF